ncbi:MAG: oligosaccharide flippase family protein [Candidatus Rifleibacteriota bacterium]
MNFLKNLSSYFIANIFSKIMGFLLFMYVSSILSPRDFGLLAIVKSLISNSSSFVFLGLGTVILTHYIHEKNKEKLLIDINNIFFRSFATFTIIITAAFFLIDFSNKTENFFHSLISLSFVLSSVFLAFYTDISINLLRIENRISSMIRISILSTILNTFLVIILLHFFKSFFVLLIGSLLVYLMYFFYLIKNYPFIFKFRSENIFQSHILKVSIPSMLSSIFTSLLLTTDKYMLANFINIETVGIYEVSLRFGSLYDTGIAVVFTTIYMPWLINKMKNNFVKFFRVNLMVAFLNLLIPVFIIFIPDSFWQLFELLIGKDFHTSIIYIKFSIINFVLFHSITMLNIVFLFLKNSRIMATTIFLMLTTNCFLNVFLIPRYEIFGAIASSYTCIIAAIFILAGIQLANREKYQELAKNL